MGVSVLDKFNLRTMLEALNNVTNKEEGSAFLQKCPDITSLFVNCLYANQTIDIHRKSLEFLANISHHISRESEEFFHDVEKKVTNAFKGLLTNLKKNHFRLLER